MKQLPFAQKTLADNSAVLWDNALGKKTLNELSIVTLHAACHALQQQCDQQKLTIIDYKQKSHYWKEMHERAVAREKEQKEEYDKIIEELNAKIRKLNKQLFGKKSEKSKGKSEKSSSAALSDPNIDPKTGKLKKNRGQQSNNKGPARRQYNHLPEVIETIGLAPKDEKCPCCGLSFQELPGYEESDIIEVVEVKAHKRKIKRKMYTKNPACQCPGQPAIITASPASRLFPKTRFAVSVWRHLLLEKFHYQRPLEKALKVLTQQGLALSKGTVTGGFKKMLPLFSPVYNAIQKHSLGNGHWHADETRWEVYEAIEGKASSRWYLWIFKSKDSVTFKIAPTRSAKVPRDFFKGVKNGFLNVDRYSAYKCIAKDGVLILAFCWAHVRRDFLDHAKSYLEDEDWAIEWIENMGSIYHINNQRVQHEEDTDEFKNFDEDLCEAIHAMQAKYQGQLKEETLSKEQKALLTSLDNHWEGLTVFVDYPFVPMDNNPAERGLRPAVLARKAFYGSYAVWSSILFAFLMSIFQTIELWEINVHHWLDAYLNACAENNGEAPTNIEPFLPWCMSRRQLNKFKKTIDYENSS